MESINEAEKALVNGAEVEVRPDAPKASPEAQKAEQLKRVEQALRDLAPHMEQFKNADESELETHAHSQIEALEAELGTKLGQESVDLIHKNLVTEVLVRKESLKSTTEGLNQEKSVLEGEDVDLVPEERSEEASVKVEAALAGAVAPQPEVFAAKTIETDLGNDEEEDEGHNSAGVSSSDTGPENATPAEEAEAAEEVRKSAVEETIINLVKSPETVLGDDHEQNQGATPEKAVKILLESLGQMYNSQDQLVDRLKDIFGGYKLAWALDRRKRPGLNEASHKKMALEDSAKDLPMNEAQLIDHRLSAGGDEKAFHGLTKEKIIKNFIELIEKKSHLASPDVGEEDGTEAEAA